MWEINPHCNVGGGVRNWDWLCASSHIVHAATLPRHEAVLRTGSILAIRIIDDFQLGPPPSAMARNVT
jgi:hypothetical protein